MEPWRRLGAHADAGGSTLRGRGRSQRRRQFGEEGTSDRPIDLFDVHSEEWGPLAVKLALPFEKPGSPLLVHHKVT